MMILCCDTFGLSLSLSLFQENQCLFYAERPQSSTHASEEISGFIDDFFHQNSISRHILEGIAFNRGPGNFTKTRLIGGIVLGIAYALEIPILPLFHSEIIAYSISSRKPHFHTILVALDAGMENMSCAVYSPLPQWNILLPPQILSDAVCLSQYTPDIIIGASGKKYLNKLHAFENIPWDIQDDSNALIIGQLANFYISQKKEVPLSAKKLNLTYWQNKIAHTYEEQKNATLLKTDKI